MFFSRERENLLQSTNFYFTSSLMIIGRSLDMAASTRKKSLSLIFATFLCFVTLFENVAGNCKAHDASWDAAKGPIVTQPSRVDPTKIKIDWSHIITNGRYF